MYFLILSFSFGAYGWRGGFHQLAPCYVIVGATLNFFYAAPDDWPSFFRRNLRSYITIREFKDVFHFLILLC